MRPPWLIRELPAPADPSARMLALHASAPARYPAFLDSAATGTPLARHSLLLGAPGQRLVLDAVGGLVGPGRGGRFCERLDQWWRATAHPVLPASGPFAGGWFLYLGYELAGEIEPTLRLPPSPLPVVAMAWRMQAALWLDHESGRVCALAEAGAGAELERLCEDWNACAPLPEPEDWSAPAVAEDDPELYLAACRRALGHIAAGDIYQANLARRWRAALPEGVAAPALYARLRKSNPGAFAGIAQLEDLAILSSSPERLVRVRGREIDTRPIAGTRPRAGADAEAIAAMTGSAKERAEHVMLIDLERNDLGRVCEAGSVHVDEFMAVESYAHVHHIVSNVAGRLREDATPGAVIRALFPGGTITGCPKVRCLQLIGELEGRGRGAYTGAMGYLAADGSLDLNILIRTMTVRGGRIEWQAGAGIVADSVPERELEETRAKARGMLRALGRPD
ncbi:MAG TPA: aminodeoxychorismate synthase component I [Steroidobacteraceae bacterium]|nr:aminodeoxychorismate synthase component I [Steroidobacteraceae bacterium]